MREIRGPEATTGKSFLHRCLETRGNVAARVSRGNIVRVYGIAMSRMQRGWQPHRCSVVIEIVNENSFEGISSEAFRSNVYILSEVS